VSDTLKTAPPETAALDVGAVAPPPLHPAPAPAPARELPEVVHRPLRRLSLKWVPLRTHLAMAGHFGHGYVKKYYMDTFLGLLWLPLRPLADVLLRSLLFGAFLEVSSGGRPYILFLVVGSIGWFFFERVTFWGYRALQYNLRSFRSMPVPWLPAVTGTAIPGAVYALLYFLIALGVAGYYAVADGTFHLTFGAGTLYAPLGLLLLLLHGWTLGLILAPMVRLVRDLRLFLPYPLLLLYVLTPVVYTIDSMPPQYQAFAIHNPLTAPIELIRHGLLGMDFPAGASILTSVAVLAVTFPVALVLFARAERASHVRL
jgi:ABC-type polysaccharide/polyol phosphate export permease